MHFCQDELIAIMSVVPFLGVGLMWARSRYQAAKRAVFAYFGKTVPTHDHSTCCEDPETIQEEAPPTVQEDPETIQDGPYRTSAKNEDDDNDVHEIWALMWCRQRHSDDLQEFAKGRLHGFFSDPKKRDIALAIPQAALNELFRRGIPLKLTDKESSAA